MREDGRMDGRTVFVCVLFAKSKKRTVPSFSLSLSILFFPPSPCTSCAISIHGSILGHLGLQKRKKKRRRRRSLCGPEDAPGADCVLASSTLTFKDLKRLLAAALLFLST